MAANPPSQIPLVQRPPTRIVASGTITIAAGSSQSFVGSNARQDRLAIIITNLDPVLSIKVQTLNGVNCATIFAQLPWGLETSADVQIYNPNGSDVDVEVCELYPDIGNAHGVPRPAVAAAGGGTTSGGTTGGTSGGTSGGGSYGGFGGGGTAQPR